MKKTKENVKLNEYNMTSYIFHILDKLKKMMWPWKYLDGIMRRNMLFLYIMSLDRIIAT